MNAESSNVPCVVTFEGLMLFRPENANSGYRVGILEASDPESQGIHHSDAHHFKITITQFPANARTAQASCKFDENGQCILESSSLKGFEAREWVLDVFRSDIPRRAGIDADAAVPENRHDPNGDKKTFGWIMNLMSSEFHNGELPDPDEQPLNPQIHLQSGRLYTYGKTDGLTKRIIDKAEEPFGFVAEAIALGIEFGPGEMLKLTTADGREVFRLPHGEKITYHVAIENVPDPSAQHSKGHGTSSRRVDDEDETTHFQLYYDLLFPEVETRFELGLIVPPEKSPNPCAELLAQKKKRTTVPPFKCGGILLRWD